MKNLIAAAEKGESCSIIILPTLKLASPNMADRVTHKIAKAFSWFYSILEVLLHVARESLYARMLSKTCEQLLLRVVTSLFFVLL